VNIDVVIRRRLICLDVLCRMLGWRWATRWMESNWSILDIVRAFKKVYPDGNCMKPSAKWTSGIWCIDCRDNWLQDFYFFVNDHVTMSYAWRRTVQAVLYRNILLIVRQCHAIYIYTVRLCHKILGECSHVCNAEDDFMLTCFKGKLINVLTPHVEFPVITTVW